MPRKQSTRSSKLTARNADKHDLYQRSVQDPASEIAFCTRIFRRAYGHNPLVLREDFCGTALLASEWVKSDSHRMATGVDLEASVLAWGREHHVKQLGQDAKRLTLLRQDVRADVPGTFDVTMAFNFSYFIFKTRPDLKAYFQSVRRSLKPKGMFLLDHYGGPETQEALIEETKQKGFTYLWEQGEYNPIDASTTNHIHFRFNDRSMMRRAFTYDWRLWQLMELQDVLKESGFKHVDVYWEGDDGEGGGNGVFRAKKKALNDPCWNAYLVARPGST